MREYITLGSAPPDEDCAQVGTDGYREEAIRECTRFIVLLTIAFPPPHGCRFKRVSNSHDFGNYYEVVAEYDDQDEAGLDWALKAEAECPGTWAELEWAALKRDEAPVPPSQPLTHPGRPLAILRGRV